MPAEFSSITPLKGMRRVLKLSKQWPKRVPDLMRVVSYRAAQRALRTMLRRIPRGRAWRAYRESLELREVSGMGRKGSGFAIHLSSNPRDVDKNDQGQVVVYVTPKKQFGRVSEVTKILQRFSPWTLDTLPTSPDKSEAKVISRKVRPDEVLKIREARTRDKASWESELKTAGIRIGIQAGPRGESSRTATSTTPDSLFEATRLEFGIGMPSAKPHWRPAIRELVSGKFSDMIRKSSRGKQILDGFFTASTYRARAWVPATDPLSIGSVFRYSRFSKRVSAGMKFRHK